MGTEGFRFSHLNFCAYGDLGCNFSYLFSGGSTASSEFGEESEERIR